MGGRLWERQEERYLQYWGFRSRYQQTGHLETRAEGEGFVSRALVAVAWWPQLLQVLLDLATTAGDSPHCGGI